MWKEKKSKIKAVNSNGGSKQRKAAKQERGEGRSTKTDVRRTPAGAGVARSFRPSRRSKQAAMLRLSEQEARNLTVIRNMESNEHEWQLLRQSVSQERQFPKQQKLQPAKAQTRQPAITEKGQARRRKPRERPRKTPSQVINASGQPEFSKGKVATAMPKRKIAKRKAERPPTKKQPEVTLPKVRSREERAANRRSAARDRTDDRSDNDTNGSIASIDRRSSKRSRREPKRYDSLVGVFEVGAQTEQVQQQRAGRSEAGDLGEVSSHAEARPDSMETGSTPSTCKDLQQHTTSLVSSTQDQDDQNEGDDHPQREVADSSIPDLPENMEDLKASAPASKARASHVKEVDRNLGRYLRSVRKKKARWRNRKKPMPPDPTPDVLDEDTAHMYHNPPWPGHVSKTMETVSPEDLPPLPQPPPIPQLPSSGSCEWSWHDESRVLYADFATDRTIDPSDQLFFLQMLERPDLTVVSRGLASFPSVDSARTESVWVSDEDENNSTDSLAQTADRAASPSNAGSQLQNANPHPNQQLLDVIQEAASNMDGLVRPSFRRFDTQIDELGNVVGVNEVDKVLRMTFADFHRYLRQRHAVMNGDHGDGIGMPATQSETNVGASEPTVIAEERPPTNKEFTFVNVSGEPVTFNVDRTVLYLLDLDLPNSLPDIHDSFRRSMRMDALLPGGKYCMMHHLDHKTRPFMGPNLYATPPEGFTHFHQDGHGTVDSGHFCVSGYNEVVMLRRMPERHKQHALMLLTQRNGKRQKEYGSTKSADHTRADDADHAVESANHANGANGSIAQVREEASQKASEAATVDGPHSDNLQPDSKPVPKYTFFDGLYKTPHADARGAKPEWPRSEAIKQCKVMGYCPSVFVLKPGELVHINKGRLHAFRKLSSNELPHDDCHHALRQGIHQMMKRQSGKDRVDEYFCMSVAWDWMFLGFTALGIHREVSSTLECEALNMAHGCASLAIPELCLWTMASSTLRSIESSRSRRQQNGLQKRRLFASRGFKRNRPSKGKRRTAPTKQPDLDLEVVCAGISKSLEYLNDKTRSSMDRARKLLRAQTRGKCTDRICIDTTTTDVQKVERFRGQFAHGNAIQLHLDPLGNIDEYNCEICFREISNVYFQCDGCKRLLNHTNNICVDCHAKRFYMFYNDKVYPAGSSPSASDSNPSRTHFVRMLHGNSGVGSESGSVNGNSNDNANTVNAATCNNTSNVQQEDEEINADTEDDNDAVDSCICGSGRPHRPCSTCGQCSQCNCQCHTHFTVRFRVLSESAEAAVCEKVRHIAEEAISSPESLVTWPGFDRIGKLRDRVDMVLDNSRGSLLKSIEAEVAAVVQGAAPRKK